MLVRRIGSCTDLKFHINVRDVLIFTIIDMPTLKTFKEVKRYIDSQRKTISLAEIEIGEAFLDLGSLLKEYRKAHKLNQRALSAKIGISSMFLSDLENGRRTPGETTMEKILNL